MSSTPSLVIAFILDESGSMFGARLQTIEGVNQYLNSVRKDNVDKRVLFSLTKFSHQCTPLYSAALLEDIPDLNHSTYNPDGGTALYDAIGETIEALEIRLDKGIPVLVVILTDGDENASQKYSLADIQKLVAAKKELGWSFIFLGDGEDSWMTGAQIGVHSSLSFNPNDMESTMRSVSIGTKSYNEAYSSGLCGLDAAMCFSSAYDNSQGHGRNFNMSAIDSVIDQIPTLEEKENEITK